MPFLKDTFIGTNGANLNARAGETGATWTKNPASNYTGNYLITDANRVRTDTTYASGVWASYYSSGVPATAEYDIVGQLYRVSTDLHSCGLSARQSTSADTRYVGMIETNGTYTIFKLVSGTYTSLASSTGNDLSVGSTYRVRFVMRDDVKRLLVNGTQYITTTDNAITAAGRVGIGGEGTTPGNSAGGHWDSIEAYNVFRLYLTDVAEPDLGANAQTEKVAWSDRGSGVVSSNATSTITGPTAGIQALKDGLLLEFYTKELQAIAAIEGIIKFNLWGLESNTQANTGLQVKVHLVNSAGVEQSTIIDSEHGTELSTSSQVRTWTAIPTSTAIAQGQRLKVTVWGNDADGSMGNNRTFTLRYSGSSAAADGDTYIEIGTELVEFAATILGASSIASTLAFGTNKLNLKIHATDIDSTAAIGAHTLAVPVQTVVPSALGSTLAIGNAKLNQLLEALGIDSTAILGSPTVRGLYTLLPSAIQSSTAVGTHTLSSIAAILPSGIVSSLVLGSPVLVSGAVSLLPSSIPSTTVAGNPTINSLVTIVPSSIGSALQIGTASVQLAILVSTLAPTSTMGTPILTNVYTIVPVGVVSTASMGNPILAVIAIIAPATTASALALGVPVLTSIARILPSSVLSTSVIGSHVVSGLNVIAVTSIQPTSALGSAVLVAYIHATNIISTANIGTPQIASIAYIIVQPIESTNVLGTHTLTSARLIVPTGVSSALQVGTAALTGLATMLATMIDSTLVLGVPELFIGTNIVAQTIGSTLQYGAPQLNLYINMNSVAPTTLVNAPVLRSAIQASTALSTLVLGTPILLPTNAIVPQGIGSTSVLGMATLRLYLVVSAIQPTLSLGQPNVLEPVALFAIAPQSVLSTIAVGIPTLLWLPVCLTDDLLDNIRESLSGVSYQGHGDLVVVTSNYQAVSEDEQYDIVRSNGAYMGHNDWSE